MNQKHSTHTYNWPYSVWLKPEYTRPVETQLISHVPWRITRGKPAAIYRGRRTQKKKIEKEIGARVLLTSHSRFHKTTPESLLHRRSFQNPKTLHSLSTQQWTILRIIQRLFLFLLFSSQSLSQSNQWLRRRRRSPPYPWRWTTSSWPYARQARRGRSGSEACSISSTARA